MKIRTQFLWLVSGIIFVPFIVIGALALLSYYREPERTLVPGYREVSAISGMEVDREEWEKLSRFISRKPSSIDFIVLNDSAKILYSTIPESPPAIHMSDSELIEAIRRTTGKYLYQIDSPGDSNLLVVTRILREMHRPRNIVSDIIRTIIILFLVILAFSGTMSFIIARSITRSVTILEENTRRIAEGELDLAIDAKGSNEITSLTVSLNRMRLALKEEHARRSRFIMGVSHDLKTPLALIKGYTEAISDGLADDPAMMRKSLEIVGNKVSQLEEMIDDLIGFVKLNTGEWRQHLQNHAIEPLLASFARRITSDAELLGRRVEHRIELPASAIVPMDDRLFIRALENITMNAIRYTAEGGLIGIDARMEGSDALISVSDNGSGISKEDLPHIFDLFYRGSSSRREDGMGLGLSVVKNVADSHGWEVNVSSEPGTRTVFTIRIPVQAARPANA